MERIPPHSVEAERALLGACLLSPQALDVGLGLVLPEDFYKPAHQYVWDAMRRLRDAGKAVDGVTVGAALDEAQVLDDIGGPGLMLDLQADVPAISNVDTYADTVVRCSRLRSLIMAGSEIQDLAYDANADPDAALERLGLLSTNSRLLPRRQGLPDTLTTVGAFMEWYREQNPDPERAWVVPRMFRRRHRIMFVGAEGSAKTTVMRQIGHTVSNGIHPFSGYSKIEPQTVLIVDCENPEDIIYEQTELIDKFSTEPMSMSSNLHLWRCEQGMDLRSSRVDQARFEAVIAHIRPALVIIGPIYKIYSSDIRNLELSAIEFFSFIDPLRKRYDFALMMEHHAPKGQNGVRDMAPFGSVAWQRWPEFGIQLIGEDIDEHKHPHTLRVRRFRGDRSTYASWPTILRRGNLSSLVPWVGEYMDGTWKSDKENEEPEAPPPPEEAPPDKVDW